MLTNKLNLKIYLSVIITAVLFISQSSFAEFGAIGIGRTMDVHNTLEDGRSNTPAKPVRKTTSQARQERIASSTSDASQGIKSRLQEMLELANANARPANEQLDDTRRFLKSCRPFVKQLGRQNISEYYLLTSWTDYFLNNTNSAYLASQKAHNTDPSNLDAYTSYAAFSLLAGKTPSFESAEADTPLSTQGTLEFNTASLKTDLLARAVPQLNAKCLNSTSFSYQPGSKAIAILFWNLPSDRTGSQVTDSNSLSTYLSPNLRGSNMQSDSIGQSFRSFTNLYAANYANPQVSFLGVNTNRTDQIPNVINQLCSNPSPWPNAMARLPQSNLQPIADVDAGISTLVITDKAGRIVYAGQAEGFLPQMMIESIGGNIPADYLAQEDQTLPDDIDETESQHTSLNTNTAAATTAAAQHKPKTNKPAELSMEEKYDAEKKLGMAKQLFLPAAGKRFITPTQGIEICREIMHNYPDTEYALEAQRLLREEVNPRYRERYNLTDEELGL